MTFISMIFFEIVSGPWDTPVNPEQLMSVGVMLAVLVGSGVLDGVKVKVGGPGFVGVMNEGVLPDDGNLVDVNEGMIVGVLVVMGSSVLDGVGDSAANPVGSADPRMGTDTKNVRALAETIVSGSIGMIEIIGSYLALT